MLPLIFAGEQIAGYLIGLAVGFFGVAQPIMIIIVYIPWTLQLHRERALRSLAPLRRYLFAFTYLFAFLLLASWLVMRFEVPLLPGYLIGLAYTLYKGIRSCRQKLPNFSEYIKMNAEDFDPNYVAQFFGDGASQPHTQTPNEGQPTAPHSDA